MYLSSTKRVHDKQDRATYEEPWLHPEGIYFVAVNGQLVVDDQ